MNRPSSAFAKLVSHAVLFCALASASRGQIPTGEYGARRDSLAARIGDGVVVAFGGRTPVTDFGPFYQIPAFHYLTNFDEPDAAMVLVAKGGKPTTTFFLSPIDPRTAFYYGRRPDSASVERTLGVKSRAAIPRRPSIPSPTSAMPTLPGRIRSHAAASS
jgi:Xaa-Pro aminopeptidase